MLKQVKQVPVWKELPTFEETLAFQREHELALESLTTVEFHVDYFKELAGTNDPLDAFEEFIEEHILEPLALGSRYDSVKTDVPYMGEYLGKWEELVEQLKNDEEGHLWDAMLWNMGFAEEAKNVDLFANNRVFLYNLSGKLKQDYFAISFFSVDGAGYLKAAQMLSQLSTHKSVKAMHNGFTIMPWEFDMVQFELMEEDVI